jgi:transposase-like protein
MNEVVSIRNQSCPNPLCRSFGMSTGVYVSVHSQKEKRLKCKLCKKTWVVHRNQWRYGLRTNTEKVERAWNLVNQGLSVRKVAREIAVSPTTVQRWKLLNFTYDERKWS